jgi:hypothetical protein
VLSLRNDLQEVRKLQHVVVADKDSIADADRKLADAMAALRANSGQLARRQSGGRCGRCRSRSSAASRRAPADLRRPTANAQKEVAAPRSRPSGRNFKRAARHAPTRHQEEFR